jgi:hypothetical protein
LVGLLFEKHDYDDKIKQNKTNEECSTHGEIRNSYNLLGKCENHRPRGEFRLDCGLRKFPGGGEVPKLVCCPFSFRSMNIN